MAEQKSNSLPRRLLRGALRGLLALVAMALVYGTAVMLQSVKVEQASSYVVVDDPAPLTRMQTGAARDARALAQLFGAPLPMLPGYTPDGEGGNASHDGDIARVAVLRYDGLTITAVQPLTAAPLLLREGMSVSLREDLSVLGLPAVLSRQGDACCVYFTSDFATYSIYSPQAEETDFFAILDRLAWAM